MALISYLHISFYYNCFVEKNSIKKLSSYRKPIIYIFKLYILYILYKWKVFNIYNNFLLIDIFYKYKYD